MPWYLVKNEGYLLWFRWLWLVLPSKPVTLIFSSEVSAQVRTTTVESTAGISWIGVWVAVDLAAVALTIAITVCG
jgi:hypothetical protein